MIRILIAEDNYLALSQMEAFFETVEDIQIIATAQNGSETLDKLREAKPDVLILDIVMPYMDGVQVLEHLKLHNEYRPVIIVHTSVGSDDMIRRVLALGASYYMVKPVDFNSMAQRIRELCGATQYMPTEYNATPSATPPSTGISSTLEGDISDSLRKVGVSTRHSGYRYLRDSIIMALKQQQSVSHITKTLYPSVAKKHRTTPSKVERALRHAIEVAWNHDGAQNFINVFGYPLTTIRDKPTNSEFIAAIVDYYEIRDSSVLD